MVVGGTNPVVAGSKNKIMQSCAQFRSLIVYGIAVLGALSDPVLAQPKPPLPQLDSQLAQAQAAAAPYRDFAVAKAQGWTMFNGDAPLMGEHWILRKDKGGVDYVHGDAIDFSHPSNLMYSTIGGKRVLVALTYTMRLGPGEPVPEGFAGDQDRWHVHDLDVAVAQALKDRPLLRGIADAWIGAERRRTGDTRARLAMVHVWTIPNPDGVFADWNRILPYLKLGLPPPWADGASLEAAKGLHLATKSGCADSLDAGMWIANVAWQTRRKLRTACDAAAAHVRQGIDNGDQQTTNAIAEHGWHLFDAAWQSLLNDEQKKRIASITEHADHASHSHDGSSTAPIPQHQH